uniref:Glycoprotein n=1 Tax=Strongyloides venezuelensis TaxID=75913 RepID=A0A0K0EU62_STRVS
MFIFLYISVSILPLLLSSINQEEAGYEDFFPSIPKSINDDTFPFVYTSDKAYDMLYVKCPNSTYHHTNKNDKFTVDKVIQNIQKGIELAYGLFNWLPLLRNPSGSINIICGRIYIPLDTNYSKYYQWEYNVNWDNSSSFPTIMEQKLVKHRLPMTHDKCANNSDSVLIYTNDKRGNIIRVNPMKVISTYVNQKFYYFSFPEKNDTEVFKKPCAILKSYNHCPKIILKDHVYNSSEYPYNGIHIVKVFGKQGFTNIGLSLEGDLDYYHGEKVTFSKMKYRRNGTEVIENSTKNITSSFFAKVFDLVQLTYKCPQGNRYVNISETYFFVPNSLSYRVKEQIVFYFKNNTFMHPNCSVNMLNFGYLESIVYKKEAYDFEDIANTHETNGKFMNSRNLIFLKDTAERNTTLGCIYRTPDRIFILTTTYVIQDSGINDDHSKNSISSF